MLPVVIRMQAKSRVREKSGSREKERAMVLWAPPVKPFPLRGVVL